VETWLFGDSWHELTNGEGEDAQGGQASAGTVDTPCPLCSCAFVVVGPLEYHVIAGEGNAGTSLALSAGHSASFGSSRPKQILCEKAKAQQLHIVYFDRGLTWVKYVLLHLW